MPPVGHHIRDGCKVPDADGIIEQVPTVGDSTCSLLILSSWGPCRRGSECEGAPDAEWIVGTGAYSWGLVMLPEGASSWGLDLLPEGASSWGPCMRWLRLWGFRCRRNSGDRWLQLGMGTWTVYLEVPPIGDLTCYLKVPTVGDLTTVTWRCLQLGTIYEMALVVRGP
jgi:hypothetical protein